MNKLATWIPISITIVVIIVNFGVTYGQTSVRIDSVEASSGRISEDLNVFKKESGEDVKEIEKSIKAVEINSAQMRVMLEQVIKMMEKDD